MTTALSGEVVTPGDSRKIQQLNDIFRKTFVGGLIVTTQGVAALSTEVKAEVLTRVRNFSRFTTSNDPFDEHDFGSFDIAGQVYFWKISYYERARFEKGEDIGSEDPSNPATTQRVLTVLLAEEY